MSAAQVRVIPDRWQVNDPCGSCYYARIECAKIREKLDVTRAKRTRRAFGTV